jgi:hypothetical protein
VFQIVLRARKRALYLASINSALSKKMKKFICIIFLLMPFISDAGECKISGKAILWAYDACFWEYETDDSLHPGVIECVNEGEKLIKKVGTCEAKRIFKSRICAMAKEWKIEGIDPETCMSSDKPLGSAVKDGGI